MASARPSGNLTQLAPDADGRPPAQEAKRDLTSWWKQFKKASSKKEEEKTATASLGPEVFGAPLSESIKYAQIPISLADEDGNSHIYGYVPTVVAKCGVYLKDQATEIEGIFRLAGAERRIKELQAEFNMPPRYGKGLEWSKYTVHDAASVLRRYFSTLPEPIIPLRFYQRFREPLRHHRDKAIRDGNEEGPPDDFEAGKAIATYQQLISELPALNRQLLLYVLDLLAVFASKSDINRMTPFNLARIFQPGLISHPNHHLAVEEYHLSQIVLTFLIENQDSFLTTMQGAVAASDVPEKLPPHITAAQTKPMTPTSPSTVKVVGIDRSASTASVGAESVRRYGGIRRNVSTSSKRSRQSQGSPSPITPTVAPDSPYTGGSGVGVHRSNTVPSRKSVSPAVTQNRFARPPGQSPTPSQPSSLGPAAVDDASRPAAPVTAPPAPVAAPSGPATTEQRKVSTSRHADAPVRSGRMSPHLRPVPDRKNMSYDRQIELPAIIAQGSPVGTPSKERGFSNLFNRGSPSDSEKKDHKPNKLQKKSRPQNANLSAHSSNHSLGQLPQSVSPTLPEQEFAGPLYVADFGVAARSTEQVSQDYDTSTTEGATIDQAAVAGSTEGTALRDATQRNSSVTLKPGEEQAPPMPSDANTIANTNAGLIALPTEEPVHESPEKKSRWRFSKEQGRKEPPISGQNLAASSTLVGSSLGADRSTSTIGSTGGQPGRKSFTSDSHHSQASGDVYAGGSPDQQQERDKRGLRGWIRGKLDERKERTKSPPPERYTSVSPVGSTLGGEGDELSRRRSPGFSSNHPAVNPFARAPPSDVEPASYQNFGGRVITPPKTSAETPAVQEAQSQTTSDLAPQSEPPPGIFPTQQPIPHHDQDQQQLNPTADDTAITPTPSTAETPQPAPINADTVKEPETLVPEPLADPSAPQSQIVAPAPAAESATSAVSVGGGAAAIAASNVAADEAVVRRSEDVRRVPGSWE